MHLRSIANWALLCFNSVLFVFLLVALVVSRGWWSVNAEARVLPRGEAVLGMEVCREIGPFVLLTGKDFPRTDTFMLVRRGQPCDFSIQNLDAKFFFGNGRRAEIALGQNFSIAVEYTWSSPNNCKIHKLELSRRDENRSETLFDIGADGTFDVRVVTDTARGQHTGGVYVWYEGAWRKVMGGDREPEQDEFHNRLLDGTWVSFDARNGRWIPEPSKSVPVQRDHTTDKKGNDSDQNGGKSKK